VVSRETPIDLLLTDVVMPGSSGAISHSACCAITRDEGALHVGLQRHLILRYSVLRERSAFLQKPFSAEVLERKVRDLLAPG
jgi:hypothetical protein